MYQNPYIAETTPSPNRSLYKEKMGVQNVCNATGMYLLNIVTIREH